MQRIVIGFFVGLLCSEAFSFSYTETEGGDLPANPTEVEFTLDLGTNTISGTELFGREIDSSPEEVVSDQDGFGFLIPDGLMLTSVLFAYDVTVEGDVSSLLTDRSLFTDDGAEQLTEFSSEGQTIMIRASDPDAITPSPSPLFADTLVTPLPAGSYEFNGPGIGSAGLDPGDFVTWDYTITMNLEPIPLPASAWLFVSAVSLLGWAKRRAN